jgi:AraC family transcriptional regulator
MNPSQARRPNAKLSAYHRVTLQREMNGEKEMEYRIVEIPTFDIVGKSKAFKFENFAKEGPRHWKDYIASDDYKSLWDLSKGRSGAVTQAPLMSVYFPDDVETRDSFIDILGIEAPPEVVTEKFEVYTVPAATYAEFDCSYQTSMKTNRYIYDEWFASTGYQRDGNKPDIAAYFPIAFRPTKEMGVRWWIPVASKR